MPLPIPTFRKAVKIKNMEPMKEVSRPYYYSEGYKYLKESIDRDGFKPADAVWGRWNKSKRKFEIFSGTHRLNAAKEIGISSIPMWDFTGLLTRGFAIAEGIKENLSHVAYNPMDRAFAVKALSKRILKEDSEPRPGRKPTMALEESAKRTGLSFATIRNDIVLTRLPEPIQRLVGQGKLRLKQALSVAKLSGKVPEGEMVKIAYFASKGFWSPVHVERVVQARLLGKRFKDTPESCRFCGRVTGNKIGCCKRCEKRRVGKLRKKRAISSESQ
jgi:hypothetical protein